MMDTHFFFDPVSLVRGTSARDRLGACSVRGSLWSCLLAAIADAFVDCGHLSTVGPENEPVLEVEKEVFVLQNAFSFL